MSYLFTSESVSEGHPDKIADQISDALIDNFLAFDKDSKVACETLVTTGQVILAGEVKSNVYLNIQSIARNVIKTEASAVALLESRIDDIFESAVKSILECRGRLIISGMGKSGLISQKIASTMSSTGTPTYFVHPGEAIHGDLGMITGQDIIIILSNSGETSELIQILPSLKKKNVTIWPETTVSYRLKTRKVNLSDYNVVSIKRK